MPLKKFGEKLKSSLHHLSPKSKKHDEAVDGDLSPCSLPTVATSQQQQQPVQQSTQGAQQVCNPIPACANETNKLAEDKPAMGSVEQPKAQDVPESMRIQTPVPPPTVIEPASLPPDNAQLNSSSCGCENATPRWQANADIFPTMYYLIKTHSKEPINQSVLLVNPSKSDKCPGCGWADAFCPGRKASQQAFPLKTVTFNLRLCGGTNATLEKEAATIAGDYVDRVNVTITPEKETEDVYIDLLQGGNLYDKIRVQTQLL